MIDHGHHPISAITEFETRKTPWRSIWLCNTLQLLNGIQFSILFTSMWPYLRILDKSATLDFFGWITAVFPLGQTIASFLFGLWNQKTKSAKYPVATGAAIMGIGNFLYGTLPLYNQNAKWVMLLSRFIVGFGSGNLSVLRTYVATGTAPRDRVKALSLGIGMFVLGLSFGPAVMLIFTPLGPDGFYVSWFPVNMYNLPALVMVIVAIISLILLFTMFQEEYAGIINNKKVGDSITDVIVPKFDKSAAVICVGIWFVLQTVGTNTEVLMIPLAMSLYNWRNDQAILYCGLIVCVSTAISFCTYLIIGLTRVGKFDKRKVIVFGLCTFMLYHIIYQPWPFYDGPLDYMPTVGNSSEEDTSKYGGCLRRYKWCAHTTRIPLPVYLFSQTVLVGLSFPTIGSPSGTLFSDILGPRNQGFMQGMFALSGSIGRFVGPIISTSWLRFLKPVSAVRQLENGIKSILPTVVPHSLVSTFSTIFMSLFEDSGYMAPMLIILSMLIATLIIIIVFRHRLVPLQLIPPLGVPTKYKHGTFYRL